MCCQLSPFPSCDLRDPGWGGILGFRNVDCFFRTFGWPLQDAILIHQEQLTVQLPWFVGVLFLFAVLFGLFVLVVLCFWFGCFPVLCGVYCNLDSWMDCVKVRTRSLLQPSQATALHASHNSFSTSTNLWNDLAKAMKASDGKKKSPFPSSNAAIAMEYHPGNIYQSVATPRYSGTP